MTATPFCDCESGQCRLGFSGRQRAICQGVEDTLPLSMQLHYRTIWRGQVGLPPDNSALRDGLPETEGACCGGSSPPADVGRPSAGAFVRGAVGMVKAAFGMDVAPDDVLERRLDACAVCPRNVEGQCTLCSCFVSAKARIGREFCPDQRWPDDAAAVSPRAVTAPVRGADYKPWEGRPALKPWQYPVQLVIAHLDTPEPLEVAVELWRRQTVRPFMCVVDTGSTRRNVDRLLQLEADDLEVHLVRGRGYQHPSEPVSTALDVATARLQQRYQLHSHTDVFPMRPDLIADLIRMSGSSPVVGYRISPRDHASGWLRQHWPECVGHTLTLIDRKALVGGLPRWSLQEGWLATHAGPEPYPSHDTESWFNRCLLESGITPQFCGEDENYTNFRDHNIHHVRSHSSSQRYSPDHFELARQWMIDALADARQRIAAWDAEDRRAA